MQIPNPELAEFCIRYQNGNTTEFDYNKITENFYLEGSCSLNYADWHELKKDIMLKDEGFLSFNIIHIDAGKLIEDTNSIQAKLQLSLTDYEINYTYNNEI